ncbi:alpha/beta hydrolase [Nocardioides aquiterrae]|uniref:Alpha/beta fold hydrolase n=1 Tax=Nocardioides aquiterrae TaxID=203799 RepID=A0ABN1U6I3_9ACTN
MTQIQNRPEVRAPHARIGAVLTGTARVSPRLAGRLALELWRRPGRPAAVRASERAVHEAATRSSVDHRGRVTVYAWGDGDRPVLLVHGWGARASRYAELVSALLDRGYSPVAYDAWAHGSSPGPVRTILDHQVVIAALAERYGGFVGVVAHSFGVPVALHAVPAGRVVAISGMADFGQVTDGFCAGLGADQRVNTQLRRAIERRYFDGDAGIWERFSAHPAPGRELLVLHDTDDRVVDARQADLLAATGAEVIRTSGLGHSRILADPAVVAAVVAFLDRP